MTIQDWGAVGEIVGALAVVVTLAYLATQIRYARIAASDASRQSRAQGVREIALAAIHNAELRHAWQRANPESEAATAQLAEQLRLSAEEADLVWWSCCAWAFTHWAQYRSMKSSEDQRELENLVGVFYATLPMAAVWQHSEVLRALLDPGFVAWVDAVLARVAERPS